VRKYSDPIPLPLQQFGDGDQLFFRNRRGRGNNGYGVPGFQSKWLHVLKESIV
jgi:hypothetical protein